MSEVKQSNRIQTSILNAQEKKLLIWLGNHMPRWVTSDTMTCIGVVGAFMCGLGFALTWFGIYWLWLSVAGLFVHWFGDSLDGTIARVRNQQRPLYGYYLDHNIDTITEAMMFIGAGISPLMHMSVALAIYAAYLALTVYVSINAHIKSEFKLTYGKLGPTEFRIIIALANIAMMYIPVLATFKIQVQVGEQTHILTTLDITGIVILVILTIMYLVSFFKDAKWFAERDPLPKKGEE
ncbi:MAG: CDP-alcohol phosphatidyltransferase family protein [Paludibacteraceae bacterium]|nr:CDP-alcohol phosphatidyltransferase family protein [Paludibacteraceae bacterium]